MKTSVEVKDYEWTTGVGTQETVNPAFFVYREWLLYVKIWDWYRVCSFLRLNAFYLFFIRLANSYRS
jgi:hypothetical protein